jgi:hypothetical protein
MVLEMNRRGRLVQKRQSSVEARSLKTTVGLKGLSNYRSNETAVEAARQGALGRVKMATLMEYLLKKRELDNSSKPNQTSAKGSTPEKKYHW